MNMKLLLAFVAVFVVWMGGSFLVHGLLLHDDYASLPGVMRTEADSQGHMPLMLLAHALLSGAFVWVYSRGVENKPWLPQGLRFGFAVGCLAVFPTFLIEFVVHPIPSALLYKQLAFDGIKILVLGAVVAAIVRSPNATSR